MCIGNYEMRLEINLCFLKINEYETEKESLLRINLLLKKSNFHHFNKDTFLLK